MRPAPHAGPGPPLDGAEAVRSPSIEESIMAHIFFPLPSRDFDPTEVGVTWRVLTAAGHGVSFATPDGKVGAADPIMITRSEENTSELQSLMRISYDVFCLQKKNQIHTEQHIENRT